MENSQRYFCFDFKDIIIEEIALSGLEGVSFDLLWKLIEKRISNTVTNKMKERYWKFIVNNNNITLFLNPVPNPVIEVTDRCSIIHPESGIVADPPDFLDGPYTFSPVEGAYGSCAHYNTRSLLDEELVKSQSYENVAAQYYDTLVMVASVDERCHALAPHLPIQFIVTLSPVQYCMLELVGRARKNGQSTLGKSNILSIDSDPKLLFYNRKVLQRLDMVDVRNFTQFIGKKCLRSIILRLKRFHAMVLHDYPTHGPMHDLCKYLLEQDDFTETTDVLADKKLFTSKSFKKTIKTLSSYVITCEYKVVGDEPTSSKSKLPPKKRFMTLGIPSDDSSESEEESSTNTITCKYKVKVDLLRQAYELFLEAGLNGLSINDISKLLGLDFYISRSICRTFTANKLVRDFLDDKGKQKQFRYVAMTATEDFDMKYADEIKKYLHYLSESKKLRDSQNEDDDNIPLKRIKLEKDPEMNSLDESINIEDYITELDDVEGGKHKNESLLTCLSGKKGPTVRQLQYVNGILKLINENQVICGIHTLGTLVGKQIFPDMTVLDYKCIKGLLQRLLTDKQIRLYRMTIPGQPEKQYMLICLPHLRPTDEPIKSKFRDMTTKSMVVNKPKERPQAHVTPLTHCSYPRYVKIQKLHEIIVRSVYFNEDYIIPDSTSIAHPGGFSSLLKLIPEFTVDFALGNISKMSVSELNRVNISMDLYHLKLRDVPQHILEVLLNSDSFKASIKDNLKTLASMGLIQIVKDPALGKKHSNMIVSYIFYVNRNPMILDTTGKWPRDCNKKDLEKHYYFATFDNVKEYWKDVYNIATNTKIDSAKRERRLLPQPVRLQNEVYENDNGQIFGDGLGPCGFDSSLHMEMERLWSNFYSKLIDKRKSNKILPNLKLNKKKMDPKSKKIVKRPKKKPDIAKKVHKPVTKAIINDGIKRRKAKVPAKWWTIEEDKIIMFCRAAVTIMSPVSQPGSLIIRNGIAKDILAPYDPRKDSGNCHKRSSFLETNKSLGYLCDSIVNELRYRNLTCKYEGLLKKLRLLYSKNLRKVVAEGRVKALELLWLIIQIDKSKSFMRPVPCVAPNYEEFHKKFSITPAGNLSTNYYKTKDDITDASSIIKETIVMTVMVSYKSIVSAENAKIIYLLLDRYPESQLQVCLHQLRKAGAVAAKSKIINSQYSQFQLRDLTQSSYKISVSYARRWICRLNSEFVDDVMSHLLELPEGEIKGAPGINCFLLEQLACNLINIKTNTTPSILDVDGNPIPDSKMHELEDIKLSFKSGSLAMINKSGIQNYGEYYRNNIQFEDALDQVTRNSCVTIVTNASVIEEPKIIPLLKSQGQFGNSFKELKDATGYDTNTLICKLRDLESKNIIKRVGINDNTIILTEFANEWTVDIEGHNMIPMPWLNLDLTLRYNIFLKWMAVVANKIVENPGSSIDFLSEICEIITNRAVQDICMFLVKTGCIEMRVMSVSEPSLFSDDDEKTNELTEFNEYESVQNILVFPIKNTFSKYVSLVIALRRKYKVVW